MFRWTIDRDCDRSLLALNARVRQLQAEKSGDRYNLSQTRINI